MKRGKSILIGTLLIQSIYSGICSAEMVSIKGEDINLRSGPGLNYPVVFLLGPGMPLDVIKRSGDWLQVRDYENDIGWVHKSTVNNTPTVIVKANKNSNGQVNIRSGPGIKNKIVGQASYGTVFRKGKEREQWVEVEHDQGLKGWIDRNLLWGL